MLLGSVFNEGEFVVWTIRAVGSLRFLNGMPSAAYLEMQELVKWNTVRISSVQIRLFSI